MVLLIDKTTGKIVNANKVDAGSPTATTQTARATWSLGLLCFLGNADGAFLQVVACPYGRLIASFGQTLAHVPHSVQRSGSIE